MDKIRQYRKYMAFVGLIFALTAVCSTFIFGATLGESGHEVRRVQERLASLGFYSGKEDGVFSPELSDSVRAFQESNGIYVTGKTDRQTLSALFDYAVPEDWTQKLLAKYIAFNCAGMPYWEQVSCGVKVLDKLKRADSPNTLAGLIMRETDPLKLLESTPDSNARQAAAECLNGWQ